MALEMVQFLWLLYLFSRTCHTGSPYLATRHVVMGEGLALVYLPPPYRPPVPSGVEGDQGPSLLALQEEAGGLLQGLEALILLPGVTPKEAAWGCLCCCPLWGLGPALSGWRMW